MADNLVLVDFEDGIERMMGNESIYFRLLGKYKDDKSYEKSIAAIKDKKWDEAKVAVHTLKGVASNLSLTELAKQAVELEKQVKAEEVSPELLEKIINTNTQTMEEIEKIIATKN